MNWKALKRSEILEKVDAALAKNQNYHNNPILGIPGTYLDAEEFYKDAEFLKTAPFLKTMVANPNHIGCHTLGHSSSPIFKGTHEIEKELIGICSEQIFKGRKGQQDGYVATGGTEANLEAMWIYRNYFRKEYGASLDQIGVLFSEDTHYSIAKGCDLLQVKPVMLNVDPEDRQIRQDDFKEHVDKAKSNGIKYFIVIINLSTTMFGSVDKIDPIASYLEQKEYPYKIHLDAAFGGFIYPFTNPHSEHNFSNPRVSSISIDGHKMLQTPYGTGLFLIRKGFMHYVTTDEAQYVPGLDFTICGSRSGANAIVIWMLLMTYGAKGWRNKMNELIRRTDILCEQLDEMKIQYFRNPHINIVTIKSNQIPDSVAKKYELVADTYEQKPRWWKIVIMDHVKMDLLNQFMSELKAEMI